MDERRIGVLLAVAGAAAAIAGVVVGLVTVRDGGVECGSAFSGGYSGILCGDAIGTRRWIAWLLILGGLGALFFGLVVAMRKRRPVDPSHEHEWVDRTSNYDERLGVQVKTCAGCGGRQETPVEDSA